MGIEIERKYLLSNLPNFDGISYKSHDILQFYCLLKKGYVRVRRMNLFNYFMTTKTGMGISRCETECAISRDSFLILSSLADLQIRKTRYAVKVDDKIWEIDEFSDGLVIAEIELKSEDESFDMPSFIQSVIIKEVTGIEEYSNIKLAEAF